MRTLDFTVALTDDETIDEAFAGHGITFSPGDRSWRGSALCQPEGMPDNLRRKLHSARGGPYTLFPHWDREYSHFVPRADQLWADQVCNLCVLAGVGKYHTVEALPSVPWIRWHPDGIPMARCGGNGILIRLDRPLDGWAPVDVVEESVRHGADCPSWCPCRTSGKIL